jgi:Ctr copper transporter family
MPVSTCSWPCLWAVLMITQAFSRVSGMSPHMASSQSAASAWSYLSSPWKTSTESSGTRAPALQTFRYTPLQQLIRSIIHMATFAVAYFIMLLAMYFNGYIIISIFIGALLGKFLCDWESIRIPMNPVSGGAQQTSEVPKHDQELTYCCG